MSTTPEYLNEDTLSKFLEHTYKRHKSRHDNQQKGGEIDDMNYTKHHYWQLGFEQGVLHALEIVADHFLDDFQIPQQMLDKKRMEDKLIK